MGSEVPSQGFIWGVLAPRFESELTLQKSEIWRLSGFLEEYGGPADGDFYRERELKGLIDALTGLLVQAVTREVASRQLTKNSGRGVGRPKDLVTPFWAPELLSVFQRCHERAGRQSVVVGTTIDGKSKQREAGKLFDFITVIIQPLNRYLTAELGRRSLSASRLARFALDNRRRVALESKQWGSNGEAEGEQGVNRGGPEESGDKERESGRGVEGPQCAN
jgi:hypothetical protein